MIASSTTLGLAVLFTEVSREQDKVKYIHRAIPVDISVQILSALTELKCDGHYIEAAHDAVTRHIPRLLLIIIILNDGAVSF